MNCAHCGNPIQPDEPYFWGRHGGEWHPDCYLALSPMSCVVGMWMNTAGPWEALEKVDPDVTVGGVQ